MDSIKEIKLYNIKDLDLSKLLDSFESTIDYEWVGRTNDKWSLRPRSITIFKEFIPQTEKRFFGLWSRVTRKEDESFLERRARDVCLIWPVYSSKSGELRRLSIDVQDGWSNVIVRMLLDRIVIFKEKKESRKVGGIKRGRKSKRKTVKRSK